MKLAGKILILVLSLVCLLGCRDEINTIEYYPVEQKEYRLAVILPQSGSDKKDFTERYKPTVNFAINQLQEAQNLLLTKNKDSLSIKFTVEWYDENKEDLKSLAESLKQRDDIFAVIGPFKDDHVSTIADVLQETRKPVIVPCTGSESIIRQYAVSDAGEHLREPFLWSLCESDVSQSEAMITKAMASGYKSIALLVSDDVYGQTFSEWMPFQCVEMGMTLVGINKIDAGGGNLTVATNSAINSGAECIMCISENADQIKQILTLKNKYGDKAPHFLFSDGAMSETILEMGDLAEGIEGISPYIDPSSGFSESYNAKFNHGEPLYQEAHLYDAIVLAGTAAICNLHEMYICLHDDVAENDTVINPNTTLAQLTTSSYSSHYNYENWTAVGIYTKVRNTINGVNLPYVGACGDIQFDPQIFASITESTYAHWTIYNHQLLCLDYMSSSGSGKRTTVSWNWQTQKIDELSDSTFSYQPLARQYAVLVAASTGWTNYRHQADVLNMYSELKKKGWPDDHIILILDKSVAYDTKNLNQGEIISKPNGTNLFSDDIVDYDSDSLQAEDVVNILLGNSGSGRLPKVLDNTDEGTNILLYWSGHGDFDKGEFVWRDKATGLSAEKLKTTLETMSQQKKFRKMLVLAETCYSAKVVCGCQNIRGVLSIAAADVMEPSFANYRSVSLNVWLSDRFSNNVAAWIESGSSKSYREFYTYLAQHTLASHVKIFNTSYFGNISSSSPNEFFVYNN